MFVTYMKRSEYMAHGHRGLVEKEAVTQPTVHLKAARTVVCHMALLNNVRPKEKMNQLFEDGTLRRKCRSQGKIKATIDNRIPKNNLPEKSNAFKVNKSETVSGLKYLLFASFRLPDCSFQRGDYNK